MFVEQCKRTGLDPITRQIYFIKNPKDGKVQIQTSIDGFRLVAERSGQYEGQTQPQWCGEDGVWKDVWLSDKTPAAARVGVWKKGFREALYAVALFNEYAQRKYDGSLSFMWAKMPSLMIAKVAESLALRKAFPNDLSGLYTTDELPAEEPSRKTISNVIHKELATPQPKVTVAQVVSEPPTENWAEAPVPVEEQQPMFEAGTAPADDYIIPFGKKYKGMRLSDVPLEELNKYADWLQSSAAKENKPLNAQATDFCLRLETYAASLK